MTDNKSPLKWLWLSGLVIVLDQISKQMVSASFELYERLPVVPSFNITLLHNRGAAFSFLNDAGGWQRWFFVLLALGISVYLLQWLRKLPAHRLCLAIALALILGGAIGNLWDRLLHGFVVDFIQVYYQQWYFPAFNVADSAITVGAVLLLVDAFRHPADE